MPGNFTMYGREKLLAGMLLPDVTTAMSGLAIALTAEVPPSNVDVSQLVEPAAAEYSRVTYGVGSAHWALSGFGEIYNTQEVDFATVVTDWGWLSGWALIDTDADHVINAGALLDPFTAVIGGTPFLAPGTISMGLYD